MSRQGIIWRHEKWLKLYGKLRILTRKGEHTTVSFAWHYHSFLQWPCNLFLLQRQHYKHSQSCLPAFNYSIYLYKRVVKFQEKKSKCLVKAVLQEHMKNHMPYKPPPASQHFLKSSILICLRCLTSDNLSLPPISILKIKCFTRITSQIARDKKIQIFQ